MLDISSLAKVTCVDVDTVTVIDFFIMQIIYRRQVSTTTLSRLCLEKSNKTCQSYNCPYRTKILESGVEQGSKLARTLTP